MIGRCLGLWVPDKPPPFLFFPNFRVLDVFFAFERGNKISSALNAENDVQILFFYAGAGPQSSGFLFFKFSRLHSYSFFLALVLSSYQEFQKNIRC